MRASSLPHTAAHQIRDVAKMASASPPQHHLIVTLTHPPLVEANEESDILKAHNLTESEIEPAVLALARQQGPEAMHRAARLSATNRALREHGHAQLLLFSADHTTTTKHHHDNKRLLEDGMHLISHEEYFKNRQLLHGEVEAITDTFGLTEKEYRCVKGICGSIMGLQLDNAAYKRFTTMIFDSKKKKGLDTDLYQTFANYVKARFFRMSKHIAAKKRKRAAQSSETI